MQGHQKMVTECHAYGTKMAVQLAHAGRKSLCKTSTPIAPSALIFSENNGFKLPHELNLEEIETLKNSFCEAALRAEKAGYDLLELHAAHGYLLNEFLSPLSNQRTDRYGGSLENRCSLVVEICEVIMQATTLPLLVRVSADEWMEGGWNVNDTIALAKMLKKIGVAMIHVSAGGNHHDQAMPALIPLYQTAYANAIRKEALMPTIAVGLITTAQEGESLLNEEMCDLVAYGRELLRNPNFVSFAAKEQGSKELIDASYLRAF